MINQQDYYKYIKHDLIGSFLKRNGYKKNGNIYYMRKNENFFYVINIQYLRTISTNNDINFKFEFGVYFPLFNDLIADEYKSKPKIKIENCLLINYEKAEKYYNRGDYYHLIQNHSQLEKTIIAHIDDIIFPYLNNLNTLKDVINALVHSRGYIESVIAGLLLLKNSNKEEGNLLLNQSYGRLNKYWKDKLNMLIPQLDFEISLSF